MGETTLQLGDLRRDVRWSSQVQAPGVWRVIIGDHKLKYVL